MKTKVTLMQSLKAGVFASILSATVNSLLFFIFHTVGMISDAVFIQPGQPMTILPVILASIFPTLIASLVFYILEKFTKHGFIIFRIISILLLALSFLNPFMAIQGVTIPYAVSLNLMHVVVVIFLLYFIGKASRTSTNPEN